VPYGLGNCKFHFDDSRTLFVLAKGYCPITIGRPIGK
jgi:hypothetical protein